jgi:hypothetical protein
MGLETRHDCDIFALIPLDTLDLDLGRSLAFSVAGLGQSSLGFLFGSIFGGAFTGGNREGGEVCI